MASRYREKDPLTPTTPPYKQWIWWIAPVLSFFLLIALIILVIGDGAKESKEAQAKAQTQVDDLSRELKDQTAINGEIKASYDEKVNQMESIQELHDAKTKTLNTKHADDLKKQKKKDAKKYEEKEEAYNNLEKDYNAYKESAKDTEESLARKLKKEKKTIQKVQDEMEKLVIESAKQDESRLRTIQKLKEHIHELEQQAVDEITTEN